MLTFVSKLLTNLDRTFSILISVRHYNIKIYKLSKATNNQINKKTRSQKKRIVADNPNSDYQPLSIARITVSNH